MPKDKPHDKLFKYTMSIQSEAIAFVKKFLDEELTKYIDYASFKISKDTYIDEDLEEHFSDIIYSCQWKGKKTVQLSFLFEHKSSPEKYIHFQLDRYLQEGYRQQRAQKKDFSVIVPIVLYHGKENWEYKEFYEHFELEDVFLKKYIPSFHYELINLKGYEDEELMQLESMFLLSMLLLFKHKSDRDYLIEKRETIFLFLQKSENEKDTDLYFRSIITYIYSAFSNMKPKLKEITENLPTKYKNMFINTFDAARIEGKIEGKMEGKIEGETMSRIKTILNFTLSYPSFSTSQIAEITETNETFVQQVKAAFQGGDLTKARKFMRELIKEEPKLTNDSTAAFYDFAKEQVERFQ